MRTSSASNLRCLSSRQSFALTLLRAWTHENGGHPEARASPNQLTTKGASPLHLAVQLGKPELVSLLLELEADPNLASTQGQTALSLASNKKVISILQEAGAKIEAAQPPAEPTSSSAASPKKPAAKGKAKAKPFATTFATAQASLSSQIGMFSDYAGLE